MKSLRQMLAIVLMTLSLSGCDMELYSGLSEGEANQMLALLMLHQINAENRSKRAGWWG